MKAEKTTTHKNVRPKPLHDASHSLPGQQIGLYGGQQKQDVKDMVKKLNPDAHSMDSRG